MARYSVATTKDNLSSLIDKALAGEEVIITRHGKPTVVLHAVDGVMNVKRNRAEAFERLRVAREALPIMTMGYLELKRLDEEEGAL